MADKYEECPSCALEVEKGVDVCPYCSYEFPRQTLSMKYVIWLMALLLAWPVVEAVMALLGK